jgi:hypothetical protein
VAGEEMSARHGFHSAGARQRRQRIYQLPEATNWTYGCPEQLDQEAA